MTNQGNDLIQVFLSKIDEFDFDESFDGNTSTEGNLPSLEKYLSLIKDEKRRKRIASIKSKEDKKRSIVSGLLLQYSFENWLINSGQPIPKDFTCGEGQFGKPFIQGYESFHYNISHGGKYVVCAASDCEIGVDVEEYVKNKDVLKLAKRFFTMSEYEMIREITDPVEQNRFFTRLWTMKESYIKYIGRGLGYGMSGFWAEDFKPYQKDITEHRRIHHLVDGLTESQEDSLNVCEYFHNQDAAITICSNKGFPERPEVIPMIKLIEGNLF